MPAQPDHPRWLRRFLPLCGLLGLLVASPVRAQAATSDDPEAIAGCRAALGGESAWAAIESLELRGLYTSFSRTTPFRLLRKRPDLYRFEHSEAAGDLITAYDGETSWWQTALPVISRATWPVEPPTPYRRDFALDAEFEMPCVHPGEKGHTLTVKGETRFEGEPFVELAVTRRGEIERWFIDPVSFLPALRVAQSTYHGYRTEQRTHFMDYRQVAGVQLPHRIETELGNDYLVMEVESAAVNVEIDDAVFKRPLPAGMEQLARLAGHWNVTIEHRDDPAFHAERVTPWEVAETTSVIRGHFGGSLLEEHIEVTTPRPRRIRREYSFDRFREVFRITLFDDFSEHLDILEGRLEEGRLAVSNTGTDTPVQVYQQAFHLRETLYDLGPDAFKLDREVSLDGGETWRVDFRFRYTRSETGD